MRSIVVLLLALLPLTATDNIVPTAPRTPAEELKGFKLPAGFEAQLVASEPDIQKPMQMAFDARGRLWVTTSHHYPFAAETDKSTDKLFILSDFDANGKAKSVVTFDDKLNIPIGICPLPDGKSVIVGEAGRILKLTDTDGDGKADQREVLFSGFGTRDTHGMTNSYTLLPDGWIYACHGYLNDSKVKGKDGHEITMNSGNTFRFRPDGSRIEVYTRGQVNPFGMCVDPWLNIYTADCHSRPMTQLIRGACYDSFGKPHDGLGYAPHVINHMHGSTGLCGITYYAADYYPKEWNGVMFVGNCVTSRINCDKIEWHGSTPVGKELPDFLVSDDAWFRPVDIKLGPDGALYVSDFYNRIIGHYEVDLKHPGRDKDRGRVWRIVMKGVEPKMPSKDWNAATNEELLLQFANPNPAVRVMTANVAATRNSFAPELPASLASDTDRVTSSVGLYAMVQERTGEMTVEGYRNILNVAHDVTKNMTDDYSGLTIRALVSRAKWGDDERDLLLKFFQKYTAIRVRRAAIDSMTVHPDAAFVEPLLDYIPNIPADDTHMRLAARIALRNCVVVAGGVEKVKALATGTRIATLYDVACAIRTKESSGFLAKYIGLGGLDKAQQIAAAEVIGQFEPALASTVLTTSGTTHDIAQALMKGMQSAGLKKLPDGVPPVVDTLVTASLKAKTPPFAVCAATLKLATSFPESAAAFENLECATRALLWVVDGKTTVNNRAALAEAIFPIPSKTMQITLRKMIADPNEALFLRARLVASLLAKPTAEDVSMAKGLLKTAPYALALAIATGLAGDKAGADVLFASVKSGEAPARLLQETAVVNRLKSTKVDGLDAKIKELTKNLPSVEARIDEVIKARAAGFKKATVDLAKGKELFAKNCAICHQMNNEGAKVGPQLDGVGVRGLERLLEDTIDPNRNIDAAFRATKLDLKDGRSITGLLKGEEGAVYVIFDVLGKEQRIPKADVDDKTTLGQSAMPGNIDSTIPEADYYHLMAYLLDQKPKK